jgi:hypothetical protein
LNPRNTAILALVVAALGAFVWFYEIEGAEKRSEAESASKRLFAGVEADAIEWIELESEDAQNVRLERAADEGWQLVAPLAFPADRFAADGIASTLAELEADATFDTPEPLGNYGLDAEPRVRFGVGEERFALRIGNDTPIGGNVYMTDAEGTRVHAVPSWRSNALKKTVKQLREAKIVDFEAEQVKRVAIESAAGRIVLARAGEDWRLAEPLEARAAPDVVDGLLSDLSFLRADEFVDDPAPDAELGLDAPWLAIELTRDGEAPPVTLTVGAERDGNRIVRGTGAPVFEVAASRLDSLPRKLAAFRFKELARFTMDDAKRFELHFLPPDGEPLTIDGTKHDDGWDTAPEEMQPGKASRLVSELSLLRAEEVMADALGEDELAALGLAPPRATLRIYGEDEDGASLADVRLGEIDSEHGLAAMRGDEPTVFWLGADLREHLPISRAAWEESFRATGEPAPTVESDATEEPAPTVEADASDEPAPTAEADAPEAPEPTAESDALGEAPPAP